MSLSKEPGDAPEQSSSISGIDPETRPQEQHHWKWQILWWLLIFAGIGLLSAGYRTYSRFRESQGLANLSEARSQLEKLVFEPAGPEWNRQADQAEVLLNRSAGTSQKHSAQLLLGALRLNRGARLKSVQKDLAAYAACETQDLSLAALLLSKASELAWADKLVTLAWQRGDDREQALRAVTMVSFQLGRDEATVQAAQEWAKLAPDEVLAWQYLAYVAEDRGFWGDAIAALRNQIARMTGSQAEPRRRLVTYLIQVGESAEARREFSLLKQGSDDDKKSETSLVEARLLFLEGKLDAAEQILSHIDLIAIDPVEVTLLRARILTERSEFAKATPLLRECIQKAPANQEAYYLLGRVLARSGNVTEAQQLMKTHRQLVDTKGKINSLERQAGHEPQNIAVRQALVKIYEEIGLTEQAKFWQSAVRAAEQAQ